MQQKVTKSVVKAQITNPPKVQNVSKPKTTSLIANKTILQKPSTNEDINKKPLQSQIQQTKVPVTKQSASTSSTLKANNNQNIEIQRIQTINVQFQRAIQQKQSMKIIEGIALIKAERIKLVLDTQFDYDQDLLNFTQSLAKIANKINYLQWTLKGKFKDNSQAKSFGEAIGYFVQAYSIDLNIQYTEFNDRVANSLASGLKKLQQLKVLKLNIPKMLGKSINDLTEKGIMSINSVIKCNLQNIEYVQFDRLWQDEYEPPINLSNYMYLVDGYENSGLGEETTDYITDCIKKIEKRRDKLFYFEIKNDISYEVQDGKGCSCCGGNYHIDPDVYAKNVVFLMKSLIDFPYLTHFSENYEGVSYQEGADDEIEYQFQQRMDKNKKYNQHKQLIFKLTNDRLIAIMKIAVFKVNIFNYLSINPSNIFIDLYIN